MVALSAFDMNPIETGSGLKLNISENDNALSLDLALEVCEYFRIRKSGAEKIIKAVRKAVLQWRKIAEQYAIARSEQELMAKAFQLSI